MIFDLREFRRDFNLTQSDLQDILGITQSFISKIENGKEALPGIHYDTMKEKYGENVLEKYISGRTGSITIQGDGNISNTGAMGDVSTGKQDNLLDLFIPGELNITDIKDLSFDQFRDVLVQTLKKMKEAKEELEKKVIKLEGDIATRDATIAGLKNELAIRIEMITFLQKKT